MANEMAVNSLGLLFIGFTLDAWLFGVNTLQVYVYFQRYRDGWLLKSVVIIVFLSDMFNTIFSCWGIYMQLVQTPILPLQGNVPLVLESTASDITIFLVQCFFAQSVYQVSQHNKWLTGLIFGVALSAFAAGIVLTGSTITSLYLSDKAWPLLNEVFVALALGLVTLTDLIITVSLIRYLFDAKSSSERTSHLLDRLILYSVQRGVLTTISHAIVLVLWYALPISNLAWALFQLSLGKVYTLTFLTLLNRRESLKRIDHGHSDPAFQVSTFPVSTDRRDDESRCETEGATKSATLSIA